MEMTRNGDLDQMAADDERLKRSPFNDVPDHDKMKLQVHEILREIGMLTMSAVSTCYFERLDALAASSITLQENMRKLQENAMSSSRCIPQEVESNGRSLLHRCRASAHGKADNEHDDLLTAFAGSLSNLASVPARSASNSTQLGYDTPAALDHPSGCALFRGAPVGMSEQGQQSMSPRLSIRRRGRHD